MTKEQHTTSSSAKSKSCSNNGCIILIGVIASLCTICYGIFALIVGGRGLIDLFQPVSTQTPIPLPVYTPTPIPPITSAFTAKGNNPDDVTDTFGSYDTIYIIVLVNLSQPAHFRTEIEAVQGGTGFCSGITGKTDEIVVQPFNKSVAFPISAPSLGVFGMCHGEYVAQIYMDGFPRKSIRFFVK